VIPAAWFLAQEHGEESTGAGSLGVKVEEILALDAVWRSRRFEQVARVEVSTSAAIAAVNPDTTSGQSSRIATSIAVIIESIADLTGRVARGLAILTNRRAFRLAGGHACSTRHAAIHRLAPVGDVSVAIEVTILTGEDGALTIHTCGGRVRDDACPATTSAVVRVRGGVRAGLSARLLGRGARWGREVRLFDNWRRA
jgi:hypothetical protein